MSSEFPAVNHGQIILGAHDLEKTHHQGDENLTIFRDISLSLHAGEIVGLVGPSGAGKSTLLQMLGILDKPTAGKIFIQGRDVVGLSDEERTLIRREYLGFVYQFHFLQPEFSAEENVMIPQMIAGVEKSKAQKKARQLLDQMSLSHRYHHRPARLSGGEQQRVAIARALANNPRLIFADEPTGNLDPKTADFVFDMLVERVKLLGMGALIATHNMDLARRMDRVLELQDGQLREA
ncbi:MAG: ABC transporter ATP-binding protein [Pseudobdellovibrionaceae bacterium]